MPIKLLIFPVSFNQTGINQPRSHWGSGEEVDTGFGYGGTREVRGLDRL